MQCFVFVFLSPGACCSHTMSLHDVYGAGFGVVVLSEAPTEGQWLDFQKDKLKTQLQGRLPSPDPGKLVFWPGCHGDRQAAAAQEEETAASPTSRILRQPWWGRGLDTALSPADAKAPAGPLRSQAHRISGVARVTKNKKELFPASRPVPHPPLYHGCLLLSFWSKHISSTEPWSLGECLSHLLGGGSH